MKNLCKGCSESVIISNDVVDEIILGAVELGKTIVSNSIYEERLRICDRCPSLQYGTTCKHNGVFVRYHAKLAARSCPYPHDPKWREHV
ncbi:DUF6171 family protein [Lederbergia lenta]|uniref:DUF6171 family protein n=1 Tax=Lederbergia lenta TaxID=1467 RepID=UPI00203F1689|nr:DUF6171 family protein [Lederbergia lenta]MCM3111847.1 DUF6171 family protein [Lederbergia lenta]